MVRILTRDGSKITDWQKFTTGSVKLNTKQSVQVHFYKNSATGKVDYLTKDFKVKGEIQIDSKIR